MRWTRSTAVGLCFAAALLLAAPPGAASIPRPTEVASPDGRTGLDVSYPQCERGSHVPLTALAPFAVIGLNDGTAGTWNPCFQSEFNSALLLARSVSTPGASVYVNTGNPALAAKWWPTSDHTKSGSPVRNPDGECGHQAGAACAYVYGYSMAQADVRELGAETRIRPAEWWLDVETTNTWQADTDANAASLSGMVDYFERLHLDVGIYSTALQWGRIAGATNSSSSLAGLDSWLAGASIFSARYACEKNPLTPGGRVALVQYVTDLDHDVACRMLVSARARVSPATVAALGSTLTARPGDWGAGVLLAYQWNRDGVPVAGATNGQYATSAPDSNEDITVTITGTKAGFSTTSLTSAPTTIVPPSAPVE